MVGGGIAGLATARALHRQGIECDVVERAESWAASGRRHVPAGQLRPRPRQARACRQPVLERAQQIARQRFPRPPRTSAARRGACSASGVRPARASHSDVESFMRSCARASPFAKRCRSTPSTRRAPASTPSSPTDRAPPTTSSSAPTACARRIRTTMCGGADPAFLRQVSWRFLVDGFPEISTWTVWLGRRQRLPGGPPRRRTPLLLRRPRRIRADRPERRRPGGAGRALRPVRRAGPDHPGGRARDRSGRILLADRGGRPRALGPWTGRPRRRRGARDVAEHGRRRRDGARGRARHRGDARLRPAARGLRSPTTTARWVRAGPDATARPHARPPVRRTECGPPARWPTDPPEQLFSSARGAVAIKGLGPHALDELARPEDDRAAACGSDPSFPRLRAG